MFMSKCCKTVLAFGDMPLSIDKKPKKVTVILNPAANKRYLVDRFILINELIKLFISLFH